MVNTFRWGIIGPGRIARKFAVGLAAVDGARLQVVASRDGERARRFARQFNATRWVEGYQALIDADDVDAIYIANPHHAHAKATRACLDAGKPVLCEKPLTVNAAEAQPLIELARRRGVFLMEAMWSRFIPAWRQVHQWLREGAIGAPRMLSSHFGAALPYQPDERWLDPEQAGGVLLDMGVYNLSMSQWVLGADPESFEVAGLLAPTGVDARVAGTLHYADGACSQFSCNFQVNTDNDFRIAGAEGSIAIAAPFWCSQDIALRQGRHETRICRPLRANGYEYEIEEVMRCVREGRAESESMPLADTLGTLRLMDAMRQRLGVRYPFESPHEAFDDAGSTAPADRR